MLMNLKCKICDERITDTHVRVIKTSNGRIENTYLFCSDKCMKRWSKNNETD